MTNLDDEATAIALACMTEDRTTSEQRSLLRLAMRVERERNKATSANLTARHGEPACKLVDHVEGSHDPSEGDPVRLSPKDRERVDRWRASWERERADWPPRYGP